MKSPPITMLAMSKAIAAGSLLDGASWAATMLACTAPGWSIRNTRGLFCTATAWMPAAAVALPAAVQSPK